MTWTLRLLDEDGVEVAWVTAVPYEYEVTHPDSEKYDGVRPVLEGWGRPSDDSNAVAMQTDEFRLILDSFPGNIDPDSLGHLEMIQDDLVGTYVNSTTITDE